MEHQLNRVELKGTIGQINSSQLHGRKFFRFTMATNRIYKDNIGSVVIETQWTNVVAFESKQIGLDILDSLHKVDNVHVIGRLRNNRVTSENGASYSVTEILATKMRKIETTTFEPEMEIEHDFANSK